MQFARFCRKSTKNIGNNLLTKRRASLVVRKARQLLNKWLSVSRVSFLFSSERWGSCSVVNACLKLLYYAIRLFPRLNHVGFICQHVFVCKIINFFLDANKTQSFFVIFIIIYYRKSIPLDICTPSGPVPSSQTQTSA